MSLIITYLKYNITRVSLGTGVVNSGGSKTGISENLT